jgi:hypothetical protein
MTMALISSSSFPKALWPGVKTWWGEEYAKWPELWRRLYTVESSTKAYEEDVQYTGFGGFQIKDEGDAISYDTAEQGFVTRYAHAVYGLGFQITREMVEDDQYGIIGKKRSRALAFSASNTLNLLGAAPYNNAVTATWTYGDGVSLLNAAHPNSTGGTWSNLSASTFSESALEGAVIAIRKWTDDRGLRINLQADRLVLPVDLGFDAERIFESTLRVGTANNDANALRNMGMFPGGYDTNPWITGTTSWYVLTTAPDGMKCYERRPLEFSPGDNDFDTENARYKATFRISFGATDVRGIYGYDV